VDFSNGSNKKPEGKQMNLRNRGGGDRDSDGRRSVSVRQLMIRTLFYIVVFVLIIWWAKG
jgi:hypothetical protein